MPEVSSLAMLMGWNRTLVMVSVAGSRTMRAKTSWQVGELMSTAAPLSVVPRRQAASWVRRSSRSCTRTWFITLIW